MIEITFVGMYADTSPSSVSMIGSAVSEPPVLGDLGDLVAGELGQVVLLGVFLVERADVDLARFAVAAACSDWRRC